MGTEGALTFTRHYPVDLNAPLWIPIGMRSIEFAVRRPY